MSAVPTIAAVSAVVFVALALSLTVGLDWQRSQSDIRAPQNLGPVLPDSSQFQERACTCKNDWPIATNERVRSNDVFTQVASIPDPRNTSSIIAFWGQLVDHDIVLSQQSDAEGLFQIQMVPGDILLNMTRNIHRTRNGCREPRNHITPYIDATTVYGDTLSDPALLYQLRDGAKCELRTSAGDLMPLQEGSTTLFLAGDVRATEHAVLSSLHTVMLREHNRLCTFVRNLQPDWTETDVFWKTRQLVIAKKQRITYEEWLPALFGSQAWMLENGPAYLPVHRERITAEFAVVAYRFGHSMIPDPIGPFALSTLFFNAQLLVANGIEPYLQAALDTTAEKADDKVVDGLRDFMFAVGPSALGEDLVTRNLFRAREVGMETYAQMTACYSSLHVETGEQEAYIGLLQEPVVAGSSLPLNSAIIIAEQFRRIKEFDPNFYTRLGSRLGVAYEQELQRATLSTLIEDNTALVGVREQAFLRS